MMWNPKSRSLKRNDNAISPVIGTILMVAATVIIAGAVYAAVNAYNGKAAKPAPDASYKAQAIDTDGNGLEDLIKVTYISGPENAGNVAVSVSSTGTKYVDSLLDPGTDWDPADFSTYDACNADTNTNTACDSGEGSGAGSYFVTVKMGDNTLLDQTLTLKE